jgi:PTH2 family peptidyl-tRNA hydrolase
MVANFVQSDEALTKPTRCFVTRALAFCSDAFSRTANRCPLRWKTRYIARMKQVLVVNSDLALPAGKMAAQVAHASMAAFLIADHANQQKWLDVGMPKIVLAGENEAQMQLLLRRAHEANVPAYLVRDAGRTVVPEGTVTCLGLGPAPKDAIDALTGALALLK